MITSPTQGVHFFSAVYGIYAPSSPTTLTHRPHGLHKGSSSPMFNGSSSGAEGVRYTSGLSRLSKVYTLFFPQPPSIRCRLLEMSCRCSRILRCSCTVETLNPVLRLMVSRLGQQLLLFPAQHSKYEYTKNVVAFRFKSNTLLYIRK